MMKLFQKLIKVLNKFKSKPTKSVLNGKNINLTGDNTTITSNNFNVDEDGNMTCTNANINGGEVKLYSETTTTTPSIKITSPTDSDTFVEMNSGVLRGHSRGFYATQFYYNIASLILTSSDGTKTIHAGGYSTYKNEIEEDVITLNAMNGKVKCVQLEQTSLGTHKKNFEKFQDNALETIKKIDIYKYNLKNEEDGTKKHIGFVIGDNYNYSKEVTSLDNTGVDNYSFTSLCCKAIQEQQKIIEQLQEKIKEMEEKVNEKN